MCPQCCNGAMLLQILKDFCCAGIRRLLGDRWKFRTFVSKEGDFENSWHGSNRKHNNTFDGRNPAPVDRIWYVVYPIIYKVFYIPGGAGVLPSTVWIHGERELQVRGLLLLLDFLHWIFANKNLEVIWIHGISCYIFAISTGRFSCKDWTMASFELTGDWETVS